MDKFSNRIGITKPKTNLQIQSMDDDLRNSLVNIILSYFESYGGYWMEVLKYIYINFSKKQISSLPVYNYEAKNEIVSLFNSLEWYDVYNLIEVILTKYKYQSFENDISNILRIELSGYSLTNGRFIPITNKQEVDSIEEALKSTSSILKIKSINVHFKTSLEKLSLKPIPDYRNSIKESISAVEGICKLLSGEKNGGIKAALDKLSSKINIHPSLQAAYIKLYGFTSDEGGIRHPLLNEPNVGFEEAKYMLVSCSGFVNYIIDKSIKLKILQ